MVGLLLWLRDRRMGAWSLRWVRAIAPIAERSPRQASTCYNAGSQGVIEGADGMIRALCGTMRERLTWRMKLSGALLCLLVSASCSPESSWEQTLQAGQQALGQGKEQEAVRLLTAAVAQAEAFGKSDARLGLSLSNLAQAYAMYGKYVEAEPLYQRALGIFQQAYGDEHLEVASTLNNLGVLHRMHGQYAEAEPLLKRSLAIKEKQLGATHPEVALGLKNLAVLYQSDGRLELAEQAFRKALAVREKALGVEHPEVAKGLDDLAGLLRKAGREKEADALQARAAAIKAKAAGLPAAASPTAQASGQ